MPPCIFYAYHTLSTHDVHLDSEERGTGAAVEHLRNGDGVELEVPGYHLRGCLARDGARSVHRAEAVGNPGRLLVVEHHRISPDRARIAQLEQLARVLHQLDHPNLLPLLAVVDTAPGVALVRPFCPGGSLAEAVDRSPAGLPPSMVADVGAQVADGLAAVHAHGLVHGAVSADSVRFDARGRPLLADTGTFLLGTDVPIDEVTATADRPQPPTAHDPAGDVRALVAVLRSALAGSGKPGVAGSAETGPGRRTAATARPLTPAALAVPERRAEATERTVAEALEEALAKGSAPGASDARPLASALARVQAETLSATALLDPCAEGAAGDEAAAGISAETRTADAVGIRTCDAAGVPVADEDAVHLAPGRWRRVALVGAAGLLLGLTAAIAMTAVDARTTVLSTSTPPAPTPAPAPASPSTVPAPSAAAPPSSAVPRRPPPPCPDLRPPPGEGAILLADLDARDCATPVRWDGQLLEVPAAGAAPRRYELLADGDDQLLFADLSCDGRDAPVLYRPATGEVFVFEGLVAPGQQVTVTGTPTGRTGGRATIVTDDAGCDHLRVAPPAPSAQR